MKRAVPTSMPEGQPFVRVDREGRVIALCPHCEQEWKGGKLEEDAEPTVRKTVLSITCSHCFCHAQKGPILNGKIVVICCKCARHAIASVHVDVV